MRLGLLDRVRTVLRRRRASRDQPLSGWVVRPGGQRTGPARTRPSGSPPPGTAHPGTVQPGTVQPGAVQPGTVQPGGVQPGTVQPGGVQPGSVRFGAARVRLRPGQEAGVARAAKAAALVPRARVRRLDWLEEPAQAQPGSRSPAAVPLPFVAARPAGEGAGSPDGRRNCGPLERVLWRQWEEGAALPAETVAAIDRLAGLPVQLAAMLADGLDAIYVGPGGVPDLDDMTALRGVPLPSGQASWDACAGAYGGRKIIVGSRPSPTPDVMCHEVGHALDDLDARPGCWQSDSAEFQLLYDRCRPHLASDFHQQPGGLGRKEFFADAFAAIASAQRPALVDMLSGQTRLALQVMLYFNRRYEI